MKYFRKHNPLIHNETGYSLVSVLLLIVLFSALGLGLVTMTTNSVKTTAGERSDQSAYYIAEACMTLEMAEIEEIIDEVYSNTNNAENFYSTLASRIVMSKPCTEEFEEHFGQKPRAEISVTETNQGDRREYTLTSQGYIDNKKRTLEQKFSLKWQPKNNGGNLVIPEMALFVEDTITIKNGTISGDIGTRKAGASSIIVSGGPNVTGGIYVPKGFDGIAINKPDWMTSFPKAIGADLVEFPKLPNFPEFPTLPFANERNIFLSGGTGRTIELSQSQHFNQIKIESNLTLNINVGNTDKEIVVDKLLLPTGHIKLLGTGKLTIYVTDEISFGSGSSINDGGDVSRINIFLKGSKQPDNRLILAGSQKLYGSIYAEKANIRFTAGGGFNGNLFTGGTLFEMAGGAWSTSPIILAPNAKFEHTNGAIKGTIVAKSYEITGGATLTYNKMQFTEGPISAGGGGNSTGIPLEFVKEVPYEQ
ncbi:PilX N-terminal domain-containing pilus assembly protein [Bacillus sp. FJAT-50079]|uniref:DUF7305 domain-containing protein n=1 Tax=Bacillus sp. FJAT-50079 TaxID=2833577 RepID=UPI001BC97CAA|nr:PilX N-terminal domain-containing pilus assembly protein [Bacillus sp. FJAT-50079]MBS4208952.1 hypothetical protein [Bacillus sp. FJAT-50079]